MEKQTQRLAWAIVWFSFALFCFFCSGSTVGIYYFFFESTTPMNVVLQVGRGTTVITSADIGERGLRQRDTLTSRPVQVSTDLQSQATLSFMIEEDDDPRLVVAVTLRSNSLVNLRRANRPRFDWSNGRYDIELTDFEGEMDILVAGALDRPIVVQVLTARDELVLIHQTGRYAISANSSRVYVANRAGEAILFSANRSRNLLIPRGQDAVMPAGRSPVFSPARVNLLENGLFVFQTLNQPVDGILALPGRWGCSNVQQAAPRGIFEPGFFDGRSALRLRRGEGANTNGETRCKQPFADPGKDVRGYNYLELETTFLINYQSLSQCGVEGSECPLMLHIQYVDTSGVPREWYQGFYYALDPVYDYYKPRCASCTQDHQQINEKVWYTYRSGNFFNILPEEARPAHITNIEFYASGHQYDVFVSEISLFAGIAEAVPIEVQPVPTPTGS